MMTINAVPAHGYYGAPVSSQRQAAISDARLAAPSGPYGRVDKCTGNEDTCGANKVRGQQFCAGHLKQAKSLEQVADIIGSGE
jgi:hypothetical protein